MVQGLRGLSVVISLNTQVCVRVCVLDKCLDECAH